MAVTGSRRPARTTPGRDNGRRSGAPVRSEAIDPNGPGITCPARCGARSGGTLRLPPLVGAEVAGGVADGAPDPGLPGGAGPGVADPFQDGPAGRAGECVPVAAGGRVGVKGGGQVGRLGQRLGLVQRGPAAVGLGCGHRGQARGLHEPGGGQPLDPPLVQPRPVAARLARGEQPRGPLAVDGLRLAVDPAEGEGFLDDVVVGQVRPPAGLLPGDQPDPRGGGVIGASQSRHWARASISTRG